MSNFLAVATVTAALGNIIRKTIQTDEPGFVSGARVTTVRPEDFDDGAPQPGVNIYLYQTTPNAALRNIDLPTRDSGGQLVQRAQAAIDLHYLFTFYGNDNLLEPQRLLGSVVRLLHSRPVLTRDLIRQFLDSINPGDPNDFLLTSDLASQIEVVRFTPIMLNLEELSKLWSVFFQTAYRLSIAYQGSVVLIESQETPGATLPVAERNVHGTTLQNPVIERVLSQENDDAPARENRPVVVGNNLILIGKRLKGEDTLVRFDEAEISAAQLIELSDTQIKFKLATPPIPDEVLRVGKHSVQVVHHLNFSATGDPHKIFESNPVFINLRPSIGTITQA